MSDEETMSYDLVDAISEDLDTIAHLPEKASSQEKHVCRNCNKSHPSHNMLRKHIRQGCSCGKSKKQKAQWIYKESDKLLVDFAFLKFGTNHILEGPTILGRVSLDEKKNPVEILCPSKDALNSLRRKLTRSRKSYLATLENNTLKHCPINVSQMDLEILESRQAHVLPILCSSCSFNGRNYPIRSTCCRHLFW